MNVSRSLCLLLALWLHWLRPVHAAPGNVDPTFVPDADDLVRCVAVQPNGKIVIGGEFAMVGGDPHELIARLNADGTVDDGFHAAVSGGTDPAVECVAVQADGKILIGGAFTTVNGETHNQLARLNADGTVDSSFTTSVPNSATFNFPRVHLIIVQPDGRIVIVGEFDVVNGNTRFSIARLNPDGSLDTGFANSAANDRIRSAAMQADGKFVIAGDFTSVSSVPRDHVARLNTNGSLDTSLAVAVDSNLVTCVAVQADGRILLSGDFHDVNTNTRDFIARVDPSGTVDSFHPTLTGPVHCIVPQSDGRLVMAGAALPGGVAVFNANGTLDVGFSTSTDITPTGLALQSNGEVVIVGDFSMVDGSPRTRIARLQNDTTTQSLAFPTSSSVRWLRQGTTPETLSVLFEQSINGGATWTSLGFGTRITNGWQRTGLSFPASALVRARARSVSGNSNGSSSLVEATTAFDFVTQAPSLQAPATGSTQTNPVSVAFTLPEHALAGSVRLTFSGPVTRQLVLAPSVEAQGAHSFSFSTDDPAAAPEILSGASIPDGTYTVTISYRDAAGNSPASASTTNVKLLTSGAGFVDVSFDPDADDVVYATAVQLDGKIVVGGSFTNFGGVTHERLARIETNGAEDTSFNPAADNTVFSAAVQPDGRIVIGGQFTMINGETRNGIARLETDGTLDATFDPNADNAVHATAVQADGKIVLAGAFGHIGADPRNHLARLDGDGSLEASFDPDANGDVYALAVQPDGKMVVGGNFTFVGGATRLRLARLHADGTLDTDFNPGVNNVVYATALQADGKIVIGGGFTQVASVTRNYLARLHSDGTLDTSFNPNADSTVFSLTMQADGAVVVGGAFTMMGTTARSHLARVLASGTLDSVFNPNADGNIVYSVAAQADGEIVAGGDFSMIGGLSRNRIARLNNDPALQTLSAASAARAQWLLGGSYPGAQDVAFALSTDGGTIWTPLGAGTRTAGGWQRTGLNLPTTGLLRVRARTAGSAYGGSSSLVETVAPFFIPPTQVATNVTPTSATLHGSVDPAGTETIARFDFGRQPDLSDATPTPDQMLGSNSGAVPVSEARSGLTPNTTYYFRIVRISSGITTVGEILPFTTEQVAPAVATLPASGTTIVSAMLHASVNAFGQATSGHFEYGTDSALAGATSTPDIDLGSGQGAVPLDQNIAGLLDATTYYFRAIATNSTGTTQGQILSFTTPGIAPIVVTQPAEDVMLNGATFPGTVNPNGLATTAHFEFDTDAAFTNATALANVSVGNGRAATPVTQAPAILEPDTLYFFRIVAANAAGTTVGGTQSFTTGKVVVESIADTMTPVPGGAFTAFGSPAIDQGIIGGTATFKPPQGRKQTVIYAGANGTIVAASGAPAHLAASYVTLGDPVFAGEALGFAAVVKAGASTLPLPGFADFTRVTTPKPGSKFAALYSQLTTADGPKQLARQGGAAPGVSGGEFAKFPAFGLPRTRPGLIFTGTLKRNANVTKDTDFGVWRELVAGGDSELLLREGTMVSLVSGGSRNLRTLRLMETVENAADQRRSFAPDGGVAALATFADGSSGVVYVAADGSVDVPLDTNSPVRDAMDQVMPGVKFGSFEPPATASGGRYAVRVMLGAVKNGPIQLVAGTRGGPRRRVLGGGDIVPGSGGLERFITLGQPLLGESGAIGTIATLTGPTPKVKPKAIVFQQNGATSVIARLNGPAATLAPATYKRFLDVAVTDAPQARLVFTATVGGADIKANNNLGLWSVSPSGRTHLLLRTGSNIDGTTQLPTIRSFEALKAKPASIGQGRGTDASGFVAVKAKLSDGRIALLRIPLP